MVASAWVGISCGPDADAPSATQVERPPGVAAERWQSVVDAEELIHTLAPVFRDLGRAVRNLQMPDSGAQRHFDVVVTTRDVEPQLQSSALSGEGDRPEIGLVAAATVTRRFVPVTQPAPPLSPLDVDLWRPLFDEVDRFETAKFAVLRGRIAEDDRNRFETRLRLRAHARLTNGAWAWAKGVVEVDFARRADGAPWGITRFETVSLELVEVGEPLFEESLDALVSAPESRARARHSAHAALARAKLIDPEGFDAPNPHFFMGSQDRHPGISVADVDSDGDDDIFAMPRIGPAQLWVANTAGGFEERAAEFGLDLRDHNAAALFADFDNDGDVDAFIGRTLVPSVYFENVEGHFIERSSDAFPEPLPSLVSSVNAVDYDGDGLLDLYVSTYAAQMLVADRLAADRELRTLGRRPAATLLADHLSPADAAELHQRAGAEGAHEFLALPGPPNVLLRNVGGGHFVRVSGDSPLRAFRNTYQASFADYDGDGDPDVYLAHDFAPNQLLRNDGGGSFSDVTDETGTADIGFGMGVSWGDYDRDGRLDLYVSNMYSKAGKRITASLEGLDPRFAKMARGNSLLRNTGAGFERVSGDGPGEQPVEATGWSWGGQFADFDNDGRLDLHVLNGYYTAPLDAHVDVDI